MVVRVRFRNPWTDLQFRMGNALRSPGGRWPIPFWTGFAGLYACAALGAGLASADSNASTVIDTCVGERLSAAGVTPVALVDDAGFLRRVTLDLAGRIPTSAESREFAVLAAPDKRTQPVDQLLASAASALPLRNELELLLLSRLERGAAKDEEAEGSLDRVGGLHSPCR